MKNNPTPAEDLHAIASSTASPTGPSFVTPGIPAAPLATAADLDKATVAGNGTEKLRQALTTLQG